MNEPISTQLFLGSVTPTAAKADPASTPATAADGALFRSLLGGSLLARGAAKTAGTVAVAQPADATQAALELHVKDQLDRGVSLDTIAGQLADALATQVANLLGISPQAAHAQLVQAFSQAFSSGGTGPPGATSAQRATALVDRLRQIAEAATRVAQVTPGTPIRLIAGQRSDADTAKASPTPTITTAGLLRGALDALAAPAPPLVTPPAGDGRTVAVQPAQATATGGDTLLGRTLARAVLADQQRSAPADAVPVAPATSPDSAPAAPNAATAAFVRAFVAALAQGDAGGSGSGSGNGGSTLAATPLRAPAPAESPDPVSPFGLALAQHHATPVDRPVTASVPAPAPAAPDDNGIVDQILRGMQVRTADGQSEVRLRLTPEHLGDVTVKLVVSGGTVDASITANSADARDALAGGQNQLARTLADAGLKLQSFTVGLGGGGFAGTRDGANPNPQPRQGTRRVTGLGPVDADEPGDDLGLLAVPSFGPPIFSAGRGFGYNHLA